MASKVASTSNTKASAMFNSLLGKVDVKSVHTKFGGLASVPAARARDVLYELENPGAAPGPATAGSSASLPVRANSGSSLVAARPAPAAAANSGNASAARPAPPSRAPSSTNTNTRAAPTAGKRGP